MSRGLGALAAALLVPVAKPNPGKPIPSQLHDLLSSYEAALIEPEVTSPTDRPRYHDWLAQAIPPSWTVDANHLRLIGDRLDKLTRREFDRLAISMPPRHAKCQPAGAKVLMADGRQVAIEDLKEGDRVVSVNSAWDTVENMVNGTCINGYKTVLRVHLKSGRYIDCTENHPLLTINGWANAEDLAQGQAIGVLKHVPLPSNPKPLPKHFARLMGYIVGDGSFSTGQAIITTVEEATVRRLQAIADDYDWRLYKAKINYHLRSDRKTKDWQDKAPSALLRPYMSPALSRDKEVPPCLFQAPEEDIREFLSGYFSSDGTSNNRREGTACFCSTSERLLRGVQHLLGRLRVWSTLRKDVGQYKGEPYVSWRLFVSGGDLVRFASFVDIDGRKGDDLSRAVAVAQGKQHFPEHESIPADWKNAVAKRVRCAKDNTELTLGALRRIYGIRADKKYKIGTARHIVRQVADLTNNAHLKQICSEHLAWDTITSIENLGVQQTYGISVENDKNYICGEIISHNTQTVTVRYAVYRLVLAKREGKPINLLVTGYSDRFARRLSRMIRNAALEQGIELNPGKTATDEWETTCGSLVMARGVGSPPTGVGFHLIIIDDPIKSREDADSVAYREKMKDWYGDDLYTRLEPDGQILLILTRWHHDDIAAHAKSTEPGAWHELVLPAIAESDEQWEIEGWGTWKRSKGEALWPLRYPVESLLRIKAVLTRKEGERSWQALYQQRPTPLEGAFFKPAMLQRVKVLPAGLECLRRWDLAASTDGDYTAGVKMAGPDTDGFYYVCHVARCQQTPELRNNLLRETAVSDGADVPLVFPQDPGSAGIDAAESILRLLAGYDVTFVRETGKKDVRASGFAAQVNGGRVKLVEGTTPEESAWIPDFVEELRQFPRGHDDQVDAAAGAFNLLTAITVLDETNVA